MIKRNYMPRDKFPEFEMFHKKADTLMIHSKILNPEQHPNEHSIIMNRDNFKDYLVEIEGNKDGIYFRGSKSHIASIPFVRMKLKEFDDSFKRLCKLKQNEGKNIPTWPPQLLNERLQFEAHFFVLECEAEFLKKRIAEVAEEDKLLEDKKVLNTTPKGNSRMQNGKLVSVDEQNVSQTESGLYFIDDERSKFDGFSIADYYSHVVKVWALRRAKLAKETREKIRSGELKLENVTRGLKDGSSAPWPKTMPADCENYKLEIIEEE